MHKKLIIVVGFVALLAVVAGCALIQGQALDPCLEEYRRAVRPVGLVEKAFEYGDGSVTVEVYLAEDAGEGGTVENILVGDSTTGTISLPCGSPGGWVWVRWTGFEIEFSEYDSETHGVGSRIWGVSATPGDVVHLALMVRGQVVWVVRVLVDPWAAVG